MTATRIGDTILRLLTGDITKMDFDAVVNAANSSLLGGGGVDGAIHRAAGPSLLEECRGIVARHGGCATGNAVMTGAGNLPARFVIHTVGPVWTGKDAVARDAELASCYANSLRLADEHDVATIAFPSISTGAYRYPKDRAARIALSAVSDYIALGTRVLEIAFVCFDAENRNAYETAFQRAHDD